MQWCDFSSYSLLRLLTFLWGTVVRSNTFCVRFLAENSRKRRKSFLFLLVLKSFKVGGRILRITKKAERDAAEKNVALHPQ